MSKETNLKIVYLATSDLKENVRNTKIHPEKQVAKLAKCIKEFGFNNPILIDANKMVLAGHGRLLAARKLVPTVQLDHMTPAQLKAFVLADNKLAEGSDWNKAILKQEFELIMELDFDLGLDLSGFETPEIDWIINCDEIENNKKQKPDKADIMPAESDVPNIVKPGDLYQLGDSHFMYCGNSLEEESFQRLLGDKSANMVFCDPPYNVKINGHVCGSGKIKHKEFKMASGEMSSEEFTHFLETAFKNLAAYSTDGSWHLHFIDFRHTRELLAAGDKVYSEPKNMIVWNKLNAGMGSMWRAQHELIFAFVNGKAPHFNNVELGKHGRYRSNVWDYRGVSATNPGSLEDLKNHPTPKPVALVMDAILDCSNPGNIILDAFAGGGTTLLAAERTKRRAYVIEYEPKYCDVILYRYQKLFKKEVKLIQNFKEITNV